MVDQGPDPDTVQQQTISTKLAMRILEAGIDEGRRLAKPLTIAVTDAAGLLVSFVRMVGAPLATIQTAQKKAWTAVATRRPTHLWADIMKEDEPLRWGVPSAVEGVIIFGGGYPITVDAEIVGGLGVSGSHHEVDRQAAESILGALDLATEGWQHP